MRLEKLIDIIMVNIFRKNFAGFIGLDCKFNPFLIYKATTMNQKSISMTLRFLTLLKACIETIKNIEHH